VQRELSGLGQVVNPREKASIILEIVCGLRPRDLLLEPDRAIPRAAVERVERVLARLCNGMPLAYALGECFFAGRRFFVDRSVLIPRPDTETLLLEAKALLSQRPTIAREPPAVLELGTGSGALIISLAADSGNLNVVATDISQDALAIACRNARRHNVELSLEQGDLFAAVQAGSSFGLVISNPPYVATEDDLEPEVLQWEPREGLLVPQGQPGTYYHRLITREAGRFLSAGGWLALEVGEGQASEVASFFKDSGFRNVRVRRDLGGVERVVSGEWS